MRLSVERALESVQQSIDQFGPGGARAPSGKGCRREPRHFFWNECNVLFLVPLRMSKSDPKNDYELSEFIMITPQGAYPFEVLPDDPIDALFSTGASTPFDSRTRQRPTLRCDATDKTDVPALYRLRFAKNEPLSAIYFNPGETHLPGIVFAPFFDAGQMVTPCYWGSHWPLAQAIRPAGRSTTESSSRRRTTA